LRVRAGSDVELSSFKIGDFGLAVTMEEREWEDGDGKYVAPELLCDDTEATPAADIYSLGATLYEAMCGRQLERQAAMEGVVQFPESVPEPMRVLILSMLETSPLRRPTAVQVMGYCEQFYTPALPPSRLRRMDGEHPAGGGADSPECTTSPICAGDGEGDMDMDMDEATTPPFDPNYVVGGAFSMTTTPLSRDECMMSPIAPMPCLSTATHTSKRSTVH
jgi:serine/threonine protein kinase